MTDEQILKKAINKARWNGWRFKYWRRRNGLFTSAVTTKQPKKAQMHANTKGGSATVLLRKLKKLDIHVHRILHDEGFCRFLFGREYSKHLNDPLYREDPAKYFKKFPTII